MLSELYETFHLYSIMYDQGDLKKDDLTISYQDVMHFLKYYNVCSNAGTLVQFMDYYDVQKVAMESLKSTVYQQQGVKFPEFVLIILKCL